MKFKEEYNLRYKELLNKLNEKLKVEAGKVITDEKELREITENYTVLFDSELDIKAFRYIGFKISIYLDSGEDNAPFINMKEELFPVILINGEFSVNTDITSMPDAQIQHYLKCNKALYEWKNNNEKFVYACRNLNMVNISDI